MREIDGTPSLFTVAFDLASVGYSVHEYFLGGTARSYTSKGPCEPDGRWDVAPTGEAPFTTRVVVYRPADSRRANGTVAVEWLNVTGGLDVPAVWMATHRHLVRAGCTWVGVTAQRVGIEGGGVIPGLGLRHTAPDRYEALDHPGDVFSFDIFGQSARAAVETLTARHGVPVECVIAMGASQSAMHLTTFVNAFDLDDALFDAYLLQGRSGAAVPIESWNLDRLPPERAFAPAARRARLTGRDHIRADARVPVLVVQSETDVFGSLRYLPARQPDSDRFRLWEVAGAAHCDTYFLCASAHDSGALSPAELAALVARADDAGVGTELPINSGPQMHYVLQCAIDVLDRWARGGGAAPAAARLESDGDGSLVLDELGIARGGLRTPWVDAPVAVLSGLGQPGEMQELFGTTRVLAPDVLARWYPGGPDEYVERFRAATATAVGQGFLLDADRPEIEALGAEAWPS